MVITLTCQNEQVSQYNVESESKRRGVRGRFLAIIHYHIISPQLSTDRLDGQKYLTFRQQVLPDLPRNGLSLGAAEKSRLILAHRVIRGAYRPK
ncbi:hypothetical protein AVEN_36960-1 [Araneus ventricosus]|uniref:Uncharacterized protein n=1 Tax=Araneus ventricosus TaxID=182803 RepID=A0A4Y2JKH6_ARAVE|nr:hypothetical protein AVEN_36960-1 [Araneus ventricosus]